MTDEKKPEPLIKRILWDLKWSYKEGFVIAQGLFLSGIALELANTSNPIVVLRYPENLFVGFIYVSILILAYLFFRKSKWVAFMKSIPAAISSISFFALNALIMGVFMQNTNADDWTSLLSFNQVTSSWSYLFSGLYLLTALGMLILDKLTHFRLRYLGILISHLGLWLVIFAASIGNSEITRLQMDMKEGQTNFMAKEPKTGKQFEMPFALKLNDFRMEEYPPKIGIVDNKSGKLLHEQGKNIRLLESESSFQILEWNVQVLEYLESAGKASDTYYYLHDIGAPPAAYLQAISAKGDTVKGWISCGSFNTQYEGLKLDETHSLIMLFPEPKNFISDIELFLPKGKQSEFSIEVNKPYSWEEWEIYQLSYDDEFGKWSDSSVVELVRDPWLPIVYSGIFLMLAGALYLFWFGRTRINKQKDGLD